MTSRCEATGSNPIVVANGRIPCASLRGARLALDCRWVESENRHVRLRVSSKGMRIIDRLGIDSALADIRARGEKV